MDSMMVASNIPFFSPFGLYPNGFHEEGFQPKSGGLQHPLARLYPDGFHEERASNLRVVASNIR